MTPDELAEWVADDDARYEELLDIIAFEVHRFGLTDAPSDVYGAVLWLVEIRGHDPQDLRTEIEDGL